MSGIRIDFAELETAFENHAPEVRSYLSRETGEIIVTTTEMAPDDPVLVRVREAPDQHVLIEPVASREQYRMMESFIITVNIELLKTQLSDAIVGKGAFRRFKDVVGRHPEERKRWFAFRDVLLHTYILDWLKRHRIELLEMPDWTLELPEPGAAEDATGEQAAAPDEESTATLSPQEARDLRDYLQAWARSHGDEYRYLFGPAAFDRLAEDISQEFTFYRRH